MISGCGLRRRSRSASACHICEEFCSTSIFWELEDRDSNIDVFMFLGFNSVFPLSNYLRFAV